MEEVNKFHKDSQQKPIKQVKQTVWTVQNLKSEIEAIKKTQTKGMLEIENLSKRTETTNASITNKLQEMKERLSGVEDMIEEIDSSVKENVKSNKFLAQNI